MYRISLFVFFAFLSLGAVSAVDAQSIEELAPSVVSEIAALYDLDGPIKVDSAPPYGPSEEQRENVEAERRAREISETTGIPIASMNGARACTPPPKRCGFKDAEAFLRVGKLTVDGNSAMLPVHVWVTRNRDDAGFFSILRLHYERAGSAWEFVRIEIQAES